MPKSHHAEHNLNYRHPINTLDTGADQPLRLSDPITYLQTWGTSPPASLALPNITKLHLLIDAEHTLLAIPILIPCFITSTNPNPILKQLTYVFLKHKRRGFHQIPITILPTIHLSGLIRYPKTWRNLQLPHLMSSFSHYLQYHLYCPNPISKTSFVASMLPNCSGKAF